MHTPTCHRCHADLGVAIYDHQGERVPLCRSCAPESSPVVEVRDLAAVTASGVCWCELERHNLRVKWCPHINQERE
jgi:hypothetical protein